MDDVKTFVVGKKLYHDSSSKQVTGEAVYVDDISTPEGTLHAALITSPCAYGKLKDFDLNELDKLPYKTFFFQLKTFLAKMISGQYLAMNQFLLKKSLHILDNRLVL